MNSILYIRKSTESEDRQVMSLGAQEREMRDIAIKNNMTIVGVYKESMSAKDPGRPEFNKMIKGIRKGKAPSVLSWKLDRLTRN